MLRRLTSQSTLNSITRRIILSPVSATSTSIQHRTMASTKAQTQFTQILKGEIDSIKAAGTYKSERIITSPQNSSIKVAGKDGKTTPQINFCANNYLGLADHPEVVARSKKFLDTHGSGLSSVRFICGTQ
ncbi:hypothetical protein BGZ76_003798, partial [Entomortierella beljakovae]